MPRWANFLQRPHDGSATSPSSATDDSASFARHHPHGVAEGPETSSETAASKRWRLPSYDSPTSIGMSEAGVGSSSEPIRPCTTWAGDVGLGVQAWVGHGSQQVADRPHSRAAGIFGAIAVATGRGIHAKAVLSPWLLLGVVPTAVGLALVLR